ncbi:MAG: methylenetetrahydrofolate reductase [Proteobacteria bacterium]|nr:methylenetetrahydrofolate reductase [Pseudomonadota bacterium]MBU1389054.1 methylenetetrahydrofolate reductase [Pseudomonadota bacterium]MBU1543606.1 methylenetetrahydrofolate reductase [Pseudomonadota bacterium]MBU2481957.1 methylenetetrahydrofolate reductase [Pseudomonadota bacterium]
MNLKDALKTKKFVVTSEVQAPLGDEESGGLAEALERENAGKGDFVLSKMDLEGVVSDTIKTCGLLKEKGIQPIYQMTIREKNRFQIQKDLRLAHDAGVENLLVFTEDYRISGDTLQESMFFHVDSGKLASVMDHLKESRTIEGNDLDDKIDMFMGAGIETPWGKNMSRRGMEEMEDMMNVGTGYFLTTPIFDIEQFAKFMKQVEPFKIPVIAEVMILRTAGMGKFLNRHFKSGLVPEWVIQKMMAAPNKKQASMELFSDTVNNLKDICQGIHVITIGGVENLVPYLNAAKLR